MRNVLAMTSLLQISTLSCLVAGLAIGLALVLLPVPMCLTLIIGLIALWIMLKLPELGILTIVVLTSSIVFEDSLPLISIGIGSLQISDVILLVFLARVLFGILAGTTKGARTPLDLPLVAFITVVIYSAYNGIAHHAVDFTVVIRILRGLFYYLIFFLITYMINDKRRIEFLIKGLYAIALVVAVTMVLQSIVGDSLQLLPGRVEKAGTFETFDTLRILPPGQTLIYCLMTVSICLAAVSQKKYILLNPAFYMIIILGVGVILTYNRTYWVAIIISTVLLLPISLKPERKRIASLLAILVISGVLLSLYSLSTGAMAEARQAVTSRFTSLFAGKELKDSGAIDDRMTENEYAMIKIAENPLLGNGLGNDYRPSIYGADDDLHNYIHNGYFFLLLNTGCIGTLFFLWFYSMFLIRGATHLRRIRDPFFRAVLTGNVFSCFGLLVMAPANPIFIQWFSIVVIAILSGLTEAIIRINDSEVGAADGR